MRRDSDWIAPFLWRSELRNTLTTLHRHQGLSLDTAIEIASDAEAILYEREFAVASRSVLELASESGRSAYDCEFVALARQRELPLVTSDRQLVRSFPDVAVSAADFAAN